MPPIPTPEPFGSAAPQRPRPGHSSFCENGKPPRSAQGRVRAVAIAVEWHPSPEIREKVMAKSTSSKTPNPFDPEALLAAQRRNVEALTSAGQIVAEGMRAYTERQVSLLQDGMRHLWGEIQNRGSATPATSSSDQPARMRAAFERVLAQVQ